MNTKRNLDEEIVHQVKMMTYEEIRIANVAHKD